MDPVLRGNRFPLALLGLRTALQACAAEAWCTGPSARGGRRRAGAQRRKGLMATWAGDDSLTPPRRVHARGLLRQACQLFQLRGHGQCLPLEAGIPFLSGDLILDDAAGAGEVEGDAPWQLSPLDSHVGRLFGPPLQDLRWSGVMFPHGPSTRPSA